MAGLLGLAVMVAGVYGPALKLPFYSDDVYHFRWVETHDFWELLIPSSSFASYRPLPSLVWFLWRRWIGFYSSSSFYALNLLLHVANGWLATGLARRLGGRREEVAWAVGATFVLYPFSYQAVLWVGAFNHLLGAFLILLAVLLYDRGRRQGSGWLVASVLVGVLAPLANEVGLTLAGLIALYEGAAPRLRSRRHLPLAAAYLLGPLVYLPVWLFLGEGGATGLVANLLQRDQLLQKATYFLQGMSFPFQFLSSHFGGQWGWSRPVVVGLGLAVSGVVLGVCYARSGRWRQLGLAGGWALLTLAPPWVAVSAAYVDTAPRLLYIPSVGVALAWGGALVALDRPRRLAPWLRLGTTLLVLIPSLLFLRQRWGLFDLVARPAREALAVVRAAPDAEPLFVNLPAWVAYKETTFAAGTEGVAFLPGYVGMSDFVWANTGLATGARAVAFANVQSDQPSYWSGSWGEVQDWNALDQAVRAADRVYATYYQVRETRLVEAGSVGGGDLPSPPVARFAGGLDLLAVRPARASGGLTVILLWFTEEPVDIGDSVFVQLVDGQGALVGQADGLALANMYPFWLCRPGDVVRDVRWLDLPGGLAAGEYTLRLGLYKLSTGERRAVWSPDGLRLTDDVVVVPLTVEP